jgi:hypothetical protein
VINQIDHLTTTPVIGRRYLVPMVHELWYGRTMWWPIIGPRHNDTEYLNFTIVHYHIDARFLNEAQWRFASHETPLRERKLAAAPICNPTGAPPQYRLRLCRRLVTGFALPTMADRTGYFPALEAAYRTSRLRHGPHGWVCPHKGAALGSCPVAPDGTIICPLHGLRWHADSGLPAIVEGA